MKLTNSKPNGSSADGILKRNKKKKRSLVIAVTVIALIVFAGLTVTLRAAAYKYIYPNVHIDGVALGGMTKEAAAETLRSEGYEKSIENIGARVSLPNGDMIEISGAQAGIRFDADLAAQRAYDYGRDEGTLKRSYLYYVTAFGNGVSIENNLITMADEEIIRNKVRGPITKLNSELSDDTYEMTDTAIELYKGSGTILADIDSVTDLVLETFSRSIRENAPASVEYVLEEDGADGGVDFNALYNSILKEPVSAIYDTETKSITESVRGISFDVEIARSKYALASTGELVSIPLVFTDPDVTKEDLEKLLFRDILAQNTTTISGTSNRLNNIILSAKAIDGLILNPGDVFSFNKVVGERTTEKGYLTAGAYSNGRTIQEVGGGICQVSSALYDSTLYADLEVVDRRNHQFIVTYLPLGNDATINWGTTDYKFKNNTDYPIRLDLKVDSRKLTVQLIGTKTTDETIKIEYEVISTREYSTIEVEDESVAPGQTKVGNAGSRGYTVETYKLRYDGEGNLIKREKIGRSTYNAQSRIVLVPVGSLTPEEPEETPEPTSEPTPEPTDPPQPTEPDEETGGQPTPTPAPTPSPTPTPTATPTPTPSTTPTPKPTATPAATPEE